MYVRLKTYLDELADHERRKPEEQRRSVPSMTELAAVSGIHKGTLSRWVTGDIRAVNLDVMQKIVAELYRRGFRPTPNDLIGLAPPDDA
jgi:DNA-binding Xre family transcriptional regulator